MIEIMRGLAALAVAWFHLTNTYETGWLQLSGSYGWLGVDFFFVLSGFVIPYSIARSYEQYSYADLSNFLARRIIRLEPPYIVSIFLVIVLWQLSAAIPGFRGGQPDMQLWQFISHVFYLVPFTEFNWMQPVYWTLAYEFAFYIIIGFSYPILFTRPNSIKILSVVSIILFIAFLGMFPSIGLLFLLGVALFFHLEFAHRLVGWERSVGAITVMLVLGSMILLDNKMSFTVGLGALLSIYYGRSFSLRHLYFRPFLGLGAISYSLYLVHVPIGGRVINLGQRLVSEQWQYLTLSLLALSISIAFAIMFWLLIEKSSMRLAQRLTTKASSSHTLTEGAFEQTFADTDRRHKVV